ncbi:MAG: ATP-binding cassette domain-containing protein [Anaerolineae bacterium]|nr:ATP-binding cassette domain-containing protein [Anaerolineae bacterium]
MNNQTIIQTTGLTRRYKTLVAVNKLDLKVPAGSVYGFLGPNGAGKTTTIRMLLGLITPDEGTVRLFGEDIHTPARLNLLRRVGSLVEMPSLYLHLTGRENLEVTRRLLDADKKHIDRVLSIVNLTADADRVTKGYSLGMKQRLGLALALLNEPDLLMLDEPTNGLDPAGIHEMRELIRSLPQQHGITVFVSSHLLSEVEQVATHLGIVRKGNLIFQGTLEALQAQRPTYLHIGARQPEAAATILQKTGWQVISQNGHVNVKAASEADAATINTALIKQGIDVYHLSLVQPSLETIFLQLTGEQPEQTETH